MARKATLDQTLASAVGERSSASPVRPSLRIDAIDALRGVALFGVLAVNLVTEFRVSIFAQFMPEAQTTSAVDRGVDLLVSLGLESKAFCLFSLLFGVGLAIQFERLGNRPDRTTLLVRRLLILLGIGVIHLFLIWNGDILTEYAIAGLLVLPFLYGPRWVIAAAAAAFLALYIAMPLLKLPLPFPAPAWIAQHVAEANRAYGAGGFAEVLAFRIKEIPALLPLHAFALPRTIMLFLLGAFVWRTGVIQDASRHRPLFWTVASVGLVGGALLTLATEGRSLVNWPSLGPANLFAWPLAPIVLALGYAASVVLLATAQSSQGMLGWAGPLGRTAFTNYLLQSVVLGWIFYGYGLGLFGRMGSATALVLGVTVYVAQAVFSGWWLQRYRFGPVEWLWRSLMYGRRQPMRRRELNA